MTMLAIYALGLGAFVVTLLVIIRATKRPQREAEARREAEHEAQRNVEAAGTKAVTDVDVQGGARAEAGTQAGMHDSTLLTTAPDVRPQVEGETSFPAKPNEQRQAEDDDGCKAATPLIAAEVYAQDLVQQLSPHDGDESRAAAEAEPVGAVPEHPKAAQPAPEPGAPSGAEEAPRLEVEAGGGHHRVDNQPGMAAEGAAQPEVGGEAHVAPEEGVERRDEELNQTSGSAALVRAPRRYRPVPRVLRAPAVPRTGPAAPADQGTRDRAMAIDVRLVFETAEFCRVSFLPRRAQGMPVELSVLGSGDPPEFRALQEDWYQDVIMPNMGRLLREGVEWVPAPSTGQPARWSLSGREIYVLAGIDELGGFVNSPRLILGEEQVVLCTTEKLADVRCAIALTGSPEPVLVGSEGGLPEGWAAIRGVVPQVPTTPSTDGNILDVLRPAPELRIALEGGVRIERQVWLAGFPPRVRIRGAGGSDHTVKIDGQDASLTDDRAYVAPGWASLGDHTVWCAGTSRAYTIREGAETWEPWDAYTWSLGELSADRSRRRPTVCGVLVRPPRAARANSRPFVVPASNPVLIGAAAGEIEFCVPRGDVRAGQCIGFPWFVPVWALPSDALHCDKRAARILLIGPLHHVPEGRAAVRDIGRRPRHRDSDVDAWCAAIRAVGYKGLRTQPQEPDVMGLWREYKQRAKALWRRRR